MRRFVLSVVCLLMIASASVSASSTGDQVYAAKRGERRVDCFHLNADGSFAHIATGLEGYGYWHEDNRLFTAYWDSCFDPDEPDCTITDAWNISIGGLIQGRRGRIVVQQRLKSDPSTAFSLAVKLRRDDACEPVA